jgi:hypothetical protein
MAALAQARDLAQAQFPLKETYRLLMQVIAHPAPIELGSAAHEPPLVDTRALAFAIGEDVEAVLDHPVEQLGAPAAAVEHDRHAPLADHSAHFSKQTREGFGQCGVDFPGDHQQRVAGAIVDPIVGGGRHGQMAARHVRLGDAALAVIGTYVAVDVEKPHEMSTLIDPQARELCAQLLGALVGGQPGELAPQSLHFRRPIQTEQSSERGRVLLLEVLGTLHAEQRHEQQREQARAQAIEGRADFTVELAADL